VSKNWSAGDNDGLVLGSEVNNGRDNAVATEGDDEQVLVVSGVYVGICKGKMGSPTSMRNASFRPDDEDVKGPNGNHADTVEQKLC
jgi:hypothetical protein